MCRYGKWMTTNMVKEASIQHFSLEAIRRQWVKTTPKKYCKSKSEGSTSITRISFQKWGIWSCRRYPVKHFRQISLMKHWILRDFSCLLESSRRLAWKSWYIYQWDYRINAHLKGKIHCRLLVLMKYKGKYYGLVSYSIWPTRPQFFLDKQGITKSIHS